MQNLVIRRVEKNNAYRVTARPCAPNRAPAIGTTNAPITRRNGRGSRAFGRECAGKLGFKGSGAAVGLVVLTMYPAQLSKRPDACFPARKSGSLSQAVAIN